MLFSLLDLLSTLFFFLYELYIVNFSFRINHNLAVILVTTCLLTLLAYKALNNESYPFSEAFQAVQNVNTMKNFLMMFVVGFLVLVHFLATLFPYGIYIYLTLLLLVTFIGWRWTFYHQATPSEEVH